MNAREVLAVIRTVALAALLAAPPGAEKGDRP
jgi:hypothetical protein